MTNFDPSTSSSENKSFSGSTNEFSQKLTRNFGIDNFEISTENYETTWGFKNARDRVFKLSNSDLKKAFEEIIENWDEWKDLKLNRNDVNPDETLTEFAANNFSVGAHKVLANDQRRGFLHLLNAIAFLSRHDDIFDKNTHSIKLEKKDYEEALARIASFSDNTIQFVASISEQAGDEGEKEAVTRILGGNNTIYYGAPGTGKSYKVDELSRGARVVRTVFHPDVQNSDFVGSLKPVREDDDITYRFSPGPFATALVDAMNNPGKEVWLVIEELNRAPAAAVFGDLFLLLDRDEDGTGEYDVNCPSEEFAHWYEEQTGDKGGKIRLPSNLWIAATMNSADQGVYPLDTAFRRRWIQEYIPIEYDKGPDGKVTVMQSGGEEILLDWREFVGILNDHLTNELSIAEDRLVGPWFVKETELGDAGVLPGKVLIYLWDDLLRHLDRTVIFRAGIKSYGSLSTKSGNGEAIFSDGFLSRIAKDTKPGADE
ncbi:AAA family ATPase [Profundibacter sp.]